MSKAKFTYDESGATFFYFVLSFLALVLIPTTYHLWPNETRDDHSKPQCHCHGCQAKRQIFNGINRRKRSRRTLIRAVIVVGWMLFFLIAYRCTTTQNEYVNWDPFEILGVREGASMKDIKKAYHKLSLIFHPDKGSSDSAKFVEISKAYAALTNEEAKKNWEQYGNPDGPTLASYGIALPSWIVEKENSFVVLGIYVLIFMVALPVSVGAWWYRSMKFGSDKVLLVTTKIYYHYIHMTPHMGLKRVIMILGGSLEFAKQHNPEVVERESDNQEVPRLIRDIPLSIQKEISDKNREPDCLSYSYSIKARALIHAHLSRMKLPQNTLELDRCYLVKKCPDLIQEMVNATSQLITLYLAGRAKNKPDLFTLENVMKLAPMMVQALWDYQSPLLQLPHFSDEILKQMERRRVKIRSIDHLAKMKEAERRKALKNFTESQYDDIKNVLGSMPLVQVECKFEVLDDEDPNEITAHSIVTAIVKLKRTSMSGLFDKSQGEDSMVDKDDTSGDDIENQKEANSESQNEKEHGKTDDNDENQKRKSNNHRSNKADNKTENSEEYLKVPSNGNQSASSDDDDDDWNKRFQEKVIKKQRVLETKPKISHPVHCPYFPDDKQEFWWVYIVDKKKFALVTAPLLVTNLKDSEEVELKFSAPKDGVYSYNIVVRSDSYVDCAITKQTRIEVKPAKQYVEPDDIPEDDFEEDVDEEHSYIEDSDLLTDSDEN